MKVKSVFTWQCDGCDQIKDTEFNDCPSGWRRVILVFEGGWGDKPTFHLCKDCLGQNPQTFIQHLKKAFNKLRLK